jgi:thioredoxin-dependent peroxiredoxin
MNPLQALAAVAAPFGIAISSAEPIEIGAALPAVTAKDQDGKEVKLAETAAKGWTLVYFYPKADTPGCTKQACSLRDSFATLTEKEVQVFGSSLDDVATQKAFQQKFKLPFTLLADKGGKVADAFGVPHSMGFAKRQAFLFKDGKLVWRDLSASTDQQAADVLKEVGK